MLGRADLIPLPSHALELPHQAKALPDHVERACEVCVLGPGLLDAIVQSEPLPFVPLQSGQGGRHGHVAAQTALTEPRKRLRKAQRPALRTDARFDLVEVVLIGDTGIGKGPRLRYTLESCTIGLPGGLEPRIVPLGIVKIVGEPRPFREIHLPVARPTRGRLGP